MGVANFIDTIVTASPEFFDRCSAEETEKYFEHALEFLQEEVGAENIFSAVVHMDERNPHMHLCFVPLTKDKRLSAKEVMGDRNKLIEWQDKFHEHMSKKFSELERGESAAVTKRKHIPTWFYKQAKTLLWGNTTILLKQAALPEYYDIAAGTKISLCCYATLTPMTVIGIYFLHGGKAGVLPTHQKKP